MSQKLHFVLVPLMAQGHLIPMVDMAKMLAAHGVFITVVTTPCNAARISSTVDRVNDLGLSIHLLRIPFPCREVGLPAGCENFDVVPCPSLITKFYRAISMLQQPLEAYLDRHELRPSCIISDKCIYWTDQTAKKLGIPRLVFHGMCCFSLLASYNIQLHGAHLVPELDHEPFRVPSMPVEIQITRAQLPGSFVLIQDLDDIRAKMAEAEDSADGVVVNSFVELEHGCAEAYAQAVNRPVWCVGPVSLCNEAKPDKFERGNISSIDEDSIFRWLETKQPCSVLYACLGSQCRLVPAQLLELGQALEASGHPFIWVIKKSDDHKFSKLQHLLLEDGFEERVGSRALLIKGWAPQLLILSHPSVRAFLTHCGWNSVLEALSFGVPLATWPLFAEQFLNEALAVDVLGVGIRVGVRTPVRWGDEERAGVVVQREMIERAVGEVMDGGEEGDGRRRRAREVGEMSRRGLESGGSSNRNLADLIRDIGDLHIRSGRGHS